MISSPLSQPLANLMRPTMRIEREDSLEQAARRMKENGFAVLPVVEGTRLFGIITEASLASAIGRGASGRDPAESACDPEARTIRSYASAAEALRALDGVGTAALVVVDDDERVLGVLAPSDLLAVRTVPNRPPMVGGMATPFGVYLTTGSIRAGASDLALMATGMILSGLLFTATILSAYAGVWLHSMGVRESVLGYLEPIALVGLFGLGMRLIPLSGIHAAEHKVVHAIERGEELVPEIVQRMPRVHPRCGTNIAVGSTIFFGIGLSNIIPDPYFRLLVALLATLFFWRRLGAVAQRWVTTRPPNEKQLMMGIRSGQELLQKFSHARTAVPNLGQRIWTSGMLQVVAGSLLSSAILAGASSLLPFDLPIR